jgi:hypothetical protein
MTDSSRDMWQRPKLIVLTRGNPEESVLTGCKSVAGGFGAGNVADSCVKEKKPGCKKCNVAGTS